MWHYSPMPKGSKAAPGILTEEVAGELRAEIARKKTKVVQARLAEAVGISTSQLSEVLGGRKQIDLDLLDKLCFALGVEFIDVITKADAETNHRQVEDDWSATRV